MPKFDEKALRLPERVEFLKQDRQLKFNFLGPNDMATALRSLTDETAPLLRLDDAAVGYSDASPPVLQHLTLALTPKSRVAVVGANGSGKSTLLKLLLGELPPAGLPESRWVHHNLRVAHISQHHLDELDDHAEESAARYLMARLGITDATARGALGRCGMSGSIVTGPIGRLSGGQKARLVFAAATWSRPHLLVCDEPTNHLVRGSCRCVCGPPPCSDAVRVCLLLLSVQDWDSVDALSLALEEYRGAVVVVSHSTEFMQAVCKELWEVADGNVRVNKGSFDDALGTYVGRIQRKFARRAKRGKKGSSHM